MRFNVAALSVATALAGHAAALRVPVKDVREEAALVEKRSAAADVEGVLQKRSQVCYEDDTLLSLQMYREDAEPFCSEYLGLGKKTTTTTVAAKTTIMTITGTKFNTVEGGTTTVASTTVTVTAAAKLRKRDDGVEPAASVISSCSESPLNATLISMVSSGCSCLRPTSATITSTVTTSSTRTINGYGDHDVTSTATVTVPTITVTVYRTGDAIPTSTALFTTGLMPASSPMSSGGMPLSTGSMIMSTGPVPPPRPTQTPDSRIVENPSSTLSLGPGTTTYPVSEPSGVPTGVSNTTSAGPTAPFSIPSSEVGTSSIVPSGITPIPTGTSSAPAATSSAAMLDHCPMDNGTTYTYLCQQFLLQCQINYPGPTDQGLYEPDVYECINGCAIANRGFSKPQCYAISYIPSNDGNNCFFKTKSNSELPESDDLVISALLINSNACPKNTTSSKRPSIGSSTMVPTGVSTGILPSVTANISIPVPPFTLGTGSREAPSVMPTMSGNSSSMPGTVLATSRAASTGVTLPSINSTLPLPTIPSVQIPSFSANLTSLLPTGPTGFPTITAPSRVFPSISANITSSMNGTSSSMCSATNTITTTVLSTTTSVVYVTITV